MNLTCGVIGYDSSQFEFGYDEEHHACLELKSLLKYKLMEILNRGITCFYTSMNTGIDMWAAEFIIDLKNKYKDIQLISVLECETLANKWSSGLRERYFSILSKYDEVIYINNSYIPNGELKKNVYIVNKCSVILSLNTDIYFPAVYSIEYANKKEREILFLN